MIAARHIKPAYQVIENEMLVYTGDMIVPVNGSTEVKTGDLVITFGIRPTLRLRLFGQEPWLYDMVMTGDRPNRVTLPKGANLTAPSAPLETPVLQSEILAATGMDGFRFVGVAGADHRGAGSG